MFLDLINISSRIFYLSNNTNSSNSLLNSNKICEESELVKNGENSKSIQNFNLPHQVHILIFFNFADSVQFLRTKKLYHTMYLRFNFITLSCNHRYQQQKMNVLQVQAIFHYPKL